jgi:hypothetical protein
MKDISFVKDMIESDLPIDELVGEPAEMAKMLEREGDEADEAIEHLLADFQGRSASIRVALFGKLKDLFKKKPSDPSGYESGLFPSYTYSESDMDKFIEEGGDWKKSMNELMKFKKDFYFSAKNITDNIKKTMDSFWESNGENAKQTLGSLQYFLKILNSVITTGKNLLKDKYEPVDLADLSEEEMEATTARRKKAPVPDPKHSRHEKDIRTTMSQLLKLKPSSPLYKDGLKKLQDLLNDTFSKADVDELLRTSSMISSIAGKNSRLKADVLKIVEASIL